MKTFKTLLKNKIILGMTTNFFMVILAVLITSLPLASNIDNLLTDQFQGNINPREEIIIVGIDDESLQEIGAWPWDRSYFADALDKISQGNPTVIGLDVLFLEPREGDDKVSAVLANTDTPIIFGSKLIYDETGYVDTLHSIYNTEAKSGFVNVDPDLDGKIRRIKAFEDMAPNCELSLSLALAKEYLKITNNSELCKQEIKLRNNNYTAENGTLAFQYTKDTFKYVSFKDLINGITPPETFENKIVVIGSLVKDLRTNLGDNFPSIFGSTISGVEIHANVLNNYLHNSFLVHANKNLVILALFIVTTLLTLLYLKIRKSIYDIIILVFAILTINFLGLGLFENNLEFPFVLANVVLILNYIGIFTMQFYRQRKSINFVRGAFGKYINVKLLTRLEKNPELLQLGGETKYMTVLFSDIRSFTSISEQMTSQELVEMINNYLEFMSTIIMNNFGTIDKYIGDAIMALWNAPLNDDTHEYNAVKSAILMKDSLKKFNDLFPQYPHLAVGIGLNTGDMTVGNIGGKDKFDYTVLGDNVNLGARLEGLTKKYGVSTIVAEATMRGVGGNEFIFRHLDTVKVKGKSEPVKIYEPFLNNFENKNIKDTYEQAFNYYNSAEFSKAIETLTVLSQTDEASKKLIERINSLDETIITDWDGVWTWDEK